MPLGVDVNRLPSLAPVRRALLRDADEDRDLLVIRVEDPPPGRGRVRIWLWMLGLSGSGSTKVLASSNPGVQRMVRASRRFVQAIPLAVSAAHEPADALVMPEEAVVTPKSYPLGDHEGLRFALGPQERLYVEPGRDQFSLAWTTALSLATLLQRLEKLLPPEQTGTWTVTSPQHDDETLTGSVHEVCEQLVAQQEPLSFWRLDLPDRAYTWERKPGGPDAIDYGLMGFIGVAFSEAYLSRLIAATATPTVGAHVPELVHQGAEAVRAAQAVTHSA